ncbi:LysR family transcriptional regulator, transcriptional activator of nhaA [Rubritalea squalenifaciens DSM 18772]|uniref:LysR family transcriptional regulator, transcriptional activator of nhaA n=1 Tax=Rubritalea squalenifaciens DSM 18772 TaxID=1123071 RepID=A0A1M6SCE1_9BACT|nr:LysR family transcriptional regulator [Rubritalea squalenifaciens]SHK42207.1 LysR family transcriptional regulator, transcriptional activator of nhaA [Rubritalea squalenifaciens DSM 18772]
MDQLNYHHLRYFYAIAREGNLTRAAEKLMVSQSALSSQLRKLEDSLGEALFERENKRLMLTEAGKIALDYADTIFKAGDELQATLEQGTRRKLQVLRIGAVATLSRNFQLAFVEPLIDKSGVEIVIRSGSLGELLKGLKHHTLDVVLANQEVTRDAENTWHSHLLDDQGVSLVAAPSEKRKEFQFPQDLHGLPVILPTVESKIRQSFDLVMRREGLQPQVVAEIDDMAMLRLMARESRSHCLVPRVVVQDELESGELEEWHRLTDIREGFYAITTDRRYPNELVRILIESMLETRKKKLAERAKRKGS